MFTDRLSNRVLSACIGLRNGSRVIVVNARLKIDPEMLAHALIEEFTHARQMIDGVDFEKQRLLHRYSDRPYEIDAKRTATEALEFEPDDCDVYLDREEPEGVLYDAVR